MSQTATLPTASSPVECSRFSRTSSSSPLPEYELWEVWITLATERVGIRARALTADHAAAMVLEHRPGWHLDQVTRWAGDNWLPCQSVPSSLASSS